MTFAAFLRTFIFILQQYKFTLTDTECWEQFLPDKPQSSQDVTLDVSGSEDEISRHLVMPNSWVNVLEVPRNSMLLIVFKCKRKRLCNLSV